MGNMNYLFNCMVFPKLWFAPDGKNEGTRMVMVLLLVVCIFIETGIKFCVKSPNLFNNLTPIKQLWHPVSAVAETVEV